MHFQKLKDLALSMSASCSGAPCLANSALKSTFQGSPYCCFFIAYFILSSSAFCISSIIWYCLLIEIDVTTVDTPSISAKITPPTIAFLKATLIPPNKCQRYLSTSNGQYTTSDKSSYDCVPWVIFLSVVNEEAIHGRKHSTPHCETT